MWDRKRVRALVQKEFGVTYQIRPISDLLKDLGYTLQTPDQRSYRQDPEKVREWQEEKLPALKKAEDESPSIQLHHPIHRSDAIHWRGIRVRLPSVWQ